MAKTPIKRDGDKYKLTQGMLDIIASHTGGATVDEMKREIGISGQTFYEIMDREPLFHEAVMNKRLECVDKVESAMYKRALGYNLKTPEKRVKKEYDPTEKKLIETEVIETTKHVHVPGEVGAQKHYLGNKAPERWAERQIVAIEGRLAQALRHVAEVLELPESEWKELKDD